MAELAFAVQAKPVKITNVPAWLMCFGVRVVRFFNRHQGELIAFLATMATRHGGSGDRPTFT